MVYIKREDLITLLNEFGIQPGPKLTVPELRELLNRARDKSKAADPETESLKGTSSMNKETLKAKARALGLSLTGNETKGAILLKIRSSATEVDRNLYDDCYMGFGKHENRTYLEVYKDFPTYISWAQTTVEEEQAPDWRLIRFVKYVQKKQAGEDTAPKVKTEKEWVKVEKTTTKTASTASASTASAAAATTERMDRMENMLLTILQAIPGHQPSQAPTNGMDSNVTSKRAASPQ